MSTRTYMLLIGPLPIAGDVVGGTKVSFAHLVDQLTLRNQFELKVHNTSRAQTGRGRIARAWNNVAALGRLVVQILRTPTCSIVFFNTSSGGAILSGPLVWALCRLRGCRLVLRVFGGDLDLFLEHAAAPVRWLARRTFLRADRLLLQTRVLCAQFAAQAHTAWWPTTREMAPRSIALRTSAKRFLFLGQLRREKGIEEALQAAQQLPSTATLSVFGPAMTGYDATPALARARCTNGGALPPERVAEVLADHDVLVFPSFHSGEGMPGIVIEAMQLGLPVIATRWRALDELIEHETNGLLVEPQDSQQLADAMTRLANDPDLFTQLQQGALRCGERFRPTEWSAWLEQELDALYESTTTALPLQEVA